MFKRYKNTKGFSLIEVLLSLAIISTLITIFIVGIIDTQNSNVRGEERRSANRLAEEGIEAMINLRDVSFTNLNDGEYGLSFLNNNWSLISGNDTNGIYTRTIKITSQPNSSKKIESTVVWKQDTGLNNTVHLVTYLTDREIHPATP